MTDCGPTVKVAWWCCWCCYLQSNSFTSNMREISSPPLCMPPARLRRTAGYRDFTRVLGGDKSSTNLLQHFQCQTPAHHTEDTLLLLLPAPPVPPTIIFPQTFNCRDPGEENLENLHLRKVDSRQMAAIRKIISGKEREREREKGWPRRFSKISLEKCWKDSAESQPGWAHFSRQWSVTEGSSLETVH